MNRPKGNDMRDKLVRFQNPLKSLPYLPGLTDADAAALLGMDLDDYRRICEDLDDQARDLARALASDAESAAAVDLLPFESGQHVVAVGESNTADRISWFEILRHLVTARRPEAAITWTNLSVSGSTTTQALSRLPAVNAHRPDWILGQLGGNDAQRLGGPTGPRLVSQIETDRNLGLLHDLAVQGTGARWVWLTMPPVDEQRIAEYQYFKAAGIAWSDADVEAGARFALGRWEIVVDTRVLRGRDGLHGEDGLHLSPAGQQALAAEVVKALAASH